jgi:hypothetical protein
MRPDAAILATQFGKACRCHIAQAAVRPVMIVIHPPTLHNVFHLIDMQEQFAIEKLITHSAVKRLYVPILPRTARLYKQCVHAQVLQEPLDARSCELRAIVAAEVGRAAAYQK